MTLSSCLAMGRHVIVSQPCTSLVLVRVQEVFHRQAAGVVEQLIGGVTRPGVDLGGLQNQLGLPSLSPSQMGPDEYTRVANYARRQHPDVMEEQVRSQPWFVKAMGNPIVMGALGVIASKLLRR